MKNKLSFFLVLSVVFLVACKGENADNIDKSEDTSEVLQNDDKDKYMSEIDEKAEETYFNSLKFATESQEYIEVKTALDKDQNLLRVKEEYSNGEGQEYGVKNYYYQNGKLSSSVKRFERHTADDIVFVEQVTYYDKNGKAESTKERIASFESDLENFPFKKVDIAPLSPEKALQVMQETGQFETTFQGFVEANSATYLIVGAGKNNEYSSALNVPNLDGSIERIRDNPKEYLGKKIKVTFTKIIDPASGYEYQELISLNFL